MKKIEPKAASGLLQAFSFAALVQRALTFAIFVAVFNALFLEVRPAHAAVTLSAADLAVVGYNSDGTSDDVAIIALADIPAGSVVFITDKGWDGNAGSFTTAVEDIVTWITPAVSVGTIFNVNSLPDGQSGVITSLSTYGDQVLIYQTDDNTPGGTPTFIYAFNNNTEGPVDGSGASDTVGQWQGDPLTNQGRESNVPAGTTEVTVSGGSGNAFGLVGEKDNAVYTGPFTVVDKETWLSRIHTKTNWTRSNMTPQDISPGGDNLPGSVDVDVPNTAPTVNAGSDQTNVLSTNASLNGSASDDGLPKSPGVLSLQWSQMSGPGTATFADSNSAITTTSFSADGTYALRLTADDGEMTAYDDVEITVVVKTPPPPPTQYDNGPNSPLVATTDLSDPEKAAYAMFESVILVTKAKIHATSCSATAGSYPISIFANGLLEGAPGEDNKLSVSSLGGSYGLDAALEPKVNFRGQKVTVSQDPEAGTFDGRAVSRYTARGFYNEANNMLVMSGAVKVVGNNGRPDRYAGRLIKDFYRGALSGPEFFLIYDWGLESLSKLGYPANKYWQRSKSRRDDGVNGRTVFVQDRLVGATACRIVIDTDGFNNEDFFWQNGTVTVSTEKPSDPVSNF